MTVSGTHQEKAFQREILDHLEAHGWLLSDDAAGYDKERALFPEDLLVWIQETSPDDFERVVPSDLDPVTRQKRIDTLLDRVTKTLAQPESRGGGTLNVLRKGFEVVGARAPFKLLAMPPADDRNPALTQRYRRNRLRVVQEVVYSQKKADRIDLVLFCNGLPVATIELKTEFTQSLEDAIAQYRRDRKPSGEPLLTAFRGALVHFALTPREVAMTTKLDGAGTRFLPFNMGFENGRGNPPDVGSRFLWEQVLERDAWLTILAKFIYVNHETQEDPVTGEVTEKAQIRFPRFHQWRAVNALVEAARNEGPGHQYLIQHSAGSGKTDSIAWTAHRLASLHRADGSKVFDTVVVIADRQVLDRQLQDAVDQLVTATGTFQAVTRGSGTSKTQQLRDALSAGVPIIGVTLQTFPYALKAMQEDGGVLAGRHFAVIADEAHSSQSGDASKAVRKVVYLSDPPDIGEAEPGADQDALVQMAAETDQDRRISFLAFTATPKAKTLEQFGRRDASGQLVPFDLYSMKQAIEEGFILDVLKNYTSYERAARIARQAEGMDEEIDVRKGTQAYIRAVELHPTNIDQKVREIIRHYQGVVQGQLGGRAKAMVITASRAAAVKFARQFRRISEEEGLGLQALVAFSGEVPDPDIEAPPVGQHPTVTETTENPQLKGRELPRVFAMPGEHVLIVANKYQTGFDQPLLVGMYVDKQLSGIAAVQTLSRLNRMAPGKNDTYVLDFVNEPEEILAAFRDYYEDAEIDQESDPYLVPQLYAAAEAAGIFTEAEVNLLWETWNRTGGKHTALTERLRPALDRFLHRWRQALLEGHDQERDGLLEFRAQLVQYVKAYAFLSQIVNYGNPRYLKFSVFADLLARQLRDVTSEVTDPGAIDVSDVVLTHYKLEKIREEDLTLGDGDARGLSGLTEAGLARSAEQEQASHSAIIEKVNRFLGDLEVDDRYKVNTLDQIISEIAGDATLRAVARSNSRVDFAHAPGLQIATEDALWQTDHSTNQVMTRIREMPWEEQKSLLLLAGLYERLREAEAS
jgi:type I restriction enzyme R subunit